MRTETVTVRHGEDVGPVDWTHPLALPVPNWRDAEQSPDAFTYGDCERPILKLCMYDGWPYWKPTPAILFVGPLGAEWALFNSYGASVQPKRQPHQPTGAEASRQASLAEPPPPYSEKE